MGAANVLHLLSTNKEVDKGENDRSCSTISGSINDPLSFLFCSKQLLNPTLTPISFHIIFPCKPK